LLLVQKTHHNTHFADEYVENVGVFTWKTANKTNTNRTNNPETRTQTGCCTISVEKMPTKKEMSWGTGGT